MEKHLEIANLRAEVECLQRDLRSQSRQIVELREWLDTICSPPWKRLWWWLRGWRWYRLGRWR